MTDLPVANRIVCFGEALWDVFPGVMKPGGAPMNVAYHLNRLGIPSTVITKVGNDKLGSELIKLLRAWEIPDSLCQVDHRHETSRVVAKMGPDYETAYEILFPVAWDFIEWETASERAVSGSDAFVFGSLAMRHAVSRDTLFRLLEVAPFKVFDVNLRKPHYSREETFKALLKADLLKVNREELGIIANWAGKGSLSERDRVSAIQDRFKIDQILVTLGDKGASYYDGNDHFYAPSYRVKVADTVGSGDAFLAAFLANRLRGKTIPEQLNEAAALGAFVASKEGACPSYSEADIQSFKGIRSC